VRIFILASLVFILNSSFVHAQSSNISLKVNAVNLIEKERFEEAKELLERIKRSDNSKDVLFMLGFVYFKTGMFNQAIDEFKDYEAAKPDNDEYHYYYALSLYESKQYNAALKEFNKAILIGVKAPQSYYYSGYINFIKDDCDKALPLFINALKEDNEYRTLAHYYSGVCLYQKGFDDKEAFESSIYHFDKVIDDKSLKQDEAKSYINLINEYLSGGAIRHKKRYNIESQLIIANSSHRIITPVEGVPVVGVDAGRGAIWGSFLLELGASPLLYENYALFIDYGFYTNIAFSSQLNSSNVQNHRPGLTFQFYNQARTFEGYAGYRYEVGFLEQDRVRRIYADHMADLGFDQSITSSWSLGLRTPIRLYNAADGVLGDFSGKSIEVILVSQHIWGATSFKFEPSALFFMGSALLPSFQYYKLTAKFNPPWEVLFLWPSIRIAPGRLVASTGSLTTYDFGAALFRAIGLGMKINIFGNAKKGFVSPDIWDVQVGLSLDYLFQ